jgi:DNA-binding protein WhiA
MHSWFSERQASSRRPERRSSTRRSAWSGAPVAAVPTCAAHSSAAGRCRVHATPISSSASGLEGARFIAEVAARQDVTLAVAERRGHAVAYAKGHETIYDLLAVAGASDVVLRLEEHAVVAATRARANRLANADEANLVRAARAAHAQLEAIRSVELDALPPHLAEIAELRLRHPSASLRELAAKARPPLSKAAAHRRLRAIVELVDA